MMRHRPSKAIVYVGDYKEKDIPCFYETWKNHQRVLVVFHTKDQKRGYPICKISRIPQ